MTGLFLHKQLAAVEDFPSVNSNICSIGLPTLNNRALFQLTPYRLGRLNGTRLRH